MSWPEAVRELWEAYIAETERLEREKKPGAGIFGLTPGPKDDPCHEQFLLQARTLLEEMQSAAPPSGEVRRTLEYIYQAPLDHPTPLTAYWSLQAVHGMTAPLAALLDREDARTLRDWYTKQYRRWERLPVQKEALAALEKAAK